MNFGRQSLVNSKEKMPTLISVYKCALEIYTAFFIKSAKHVTR
jgi:hypothetical protein